MDQKFINDLVEMLPNMEAPTLVNMYAIAVRCFALDENDVTAQKAAELYNEEINRRLA